MRATRAHARTHRVEGPPRGASEVVTLVRTAEAAQGALNRVTALMVLPVCFLRHVRKINIDDLGLWAA
jgi:hypothetical protein